MADQNGDEMLTTTQAGVLLAQLRHRAAPYKAATVAKWIREEGLDAEMGEGGRYLVQKSKLIEWAQDGGSLPADAEPQQVATNPSAPRRVIIVGKPSADQEDAEDQGGDDIDEEDLQDDDVQLAECPECGADVPITTATVTAVCPSCGEVLEVVEEGDEECDAGDDEDEETEEPAKEGRTLPNPFRLPW